MTHLVIDTKGSDHGAAPLIRGAAEALKKFDSLSVVLAGDEAEIRKEWDALSMPYDRMEILHAEAEITNYDNPAEALFKKTDSSMLKALASLSAREELFGFITAGNTGVLITGAMRYLSGKERVRPALAAVLPAQNGSFTCLVDTGATIDCTPPILHHFARLGSRLMHDMYGIESPKVGLLSNGAEPTKGNKLVKETHPLLAEDSSLNFIGNVEGNQALSGVCDVLVCDGFAGNVLLKSIEGTAMFMGSLMKRMFKKNLLSKLGYLLCASGVKEITKLMDYREIGGTQFLGIKKPVIKAHGSSDALAFRNAVKQAADAAANDMTQELEEALRLLAQTKESGND